MLTGPLLFVAASLLVVVTAASIVARVQLTARLDQAVAFGVVAVTQIDS